MIPLQLSVLALGIALVASKSQAEQYMLQDEIQEELRDELQHELPTVKSARKRIAIIGAGIAGASTAFQLHEQTRIYFPVDIAIFEQSSHVGGRVSSAHVYEDPNYDIETGGATFSEDDWCLNKGMREVGLKAESTKGGQSRMLGVWDGSKLVYQQRETSSPWWNLAKLVWRYGRYPVKMGRLVDQTIKSFHKLGRERYLPFESLDEEVKELGLKESLEENAETYLKRKVITESEGWPYMNEIIQAYSRAGFTHNLKEMHGLASMISMTSKSVQSIDGGNWRLINRMIRLSEASLHLNTQVTHISKNADGTFTLHYTATVPNGTKTPSSAIFDNVIIAAPFHLSTISLTPPLTPPPLDIPFVSIHVTHFTIPRVVSNGLFPKRTTPKEILTTLSPPLNTTTTTTTTTPNFLSLKYIKEVSYLSGCIPQTEYLYKLTTTSPVPDIQIAHLSSTLLADNLTKTQDSETSTTWIHRQFWPEAYPKFPPRQGTGFDDVQLAPGLFYTGAGENLVSSMEMSCVMADNVASRLYWLFYEEASRDSIVVP